MLNGLLARTHSTLFDRTPLANNEADAVVCKYSRDVLCYKMPQGRKYFYFVGFLCGKNKNIIDKPIVLTVYSHTCPDLTLVDLPGITKKP